MQSNQMFQDWLTVSRQLGANPLHIQGGGGNTSVKSDNGIMYIKASGYELKDLAEGTAYARLDHARIADAIQASDADAGSVDAAIEAARMAPQSEPKPSVEAGFHSFLGPCVLHTHSFYANLITCSIEGREKYKGIIGADLRPLYVPYCDPGSELSIDLFKRVTDAGLKPQQEPCVILMQNHGLIVSAKNAGEAEALHQKVCDRIQKYFGLEPNLMSDIRLERISERHYRSASDKLIQMLKTPVFELNNLLGKALYPDEIVFFRNTLELHPATVSTEDTLSGNRAFLDPQTGVCEYYMSEKQALAIEAMFYVVALQHKVIAENGMHMHYMTKEQYDFIANWDKEKYRKALQEGKSGT